MNKEIKTFCMIAALTGCAEVATQRADVGTDVAPDTIALDTGRDAPQSDTQITSDATSDVRTDTQGDSGAGAALLVINELVPNGNPDFFELYNAGTAAQDLAGYFFADADGLGTVPSDPTHRVAFPQGTSLAPGAYLVVAMNIDPPGGATETPVGPVTPCPVTGVSSCYQASFGIGRTAETIAILSPSGTEIVRVDYASDPAPASYCRTPNATGAFASCAQETPGAAN